MVTNSHSRRASRAALLCILLTMLVASLSGRWRPSVVRAHDGTHRADAVVLVNSTSAEYADFAQLIQPYLDNFGIPYTVLDIATTGVVHEVHEYAVIIVGHRQLDITDAYLDATEEDHIADAVAGGTGLVNFDNDLTPDGSTPYYGYLDDVFGFAYVPAAASSSVSFVGDTGTTIRINCWEDDHQDPDLVTTSSVPLLEANDGLWTEFLYPSRGFPSVMARDDETLATPMRFHASSIPNGTYDLEANPCQPK